MTSLPSIVVSKNETNSYNFTNQSEINVNTTVDYGDVSTPLRPKPSTM